MELHLNPKFAVEAQEDHLNYIWDQFVSWTKQEIFSISDVEKYIEHVERFYPNHPTTLKMRSDFDQLKEQP